MKKTIVLTLVTTLTGIGAIAAAQGPDSGKRHKTRGAHAERHFAKLDTDGDGRISRDEWTAAKLDRFDAADLDGDGRVTPEEMREASKAWTQKHREAREARGDGEQAKRGRHHGKRGHGMKGKWMFKRLDVDQDGAVTRAEAQAGAERFFDKLDADADGTLTQDEMKEGFRAMKEKYGKRGHGKRGHGKGRGADRS